MLSLQLLSLLTAFQPGVILDIRRPGGYRLRKGSPAHTDRQFECSYLAMQVRLNDHHLRGRLNLLAQPFPPVPHT